jgi:protoheme IX farnesyltransferase
VGADILALAKPRIILLLAITCLCGGLVASKGNGALLMESSGALLLAVVGLCLAAGGANSVNMWWDRDIDPLMARTKNRPLPQGRLTPGFALGWGAGMITLGTAVAMLAHPLAGLMNLAGALFYVGVYTMLLKRRTVQNIVIGGAAGAFPPLVGWAAVQGGLAEPLPWLMFAVIFLWTPPHFWALALMTNADYTRAGVPMYPVVHGEPATRLEMVRYALLLAVITVLAGLYQPLGPLYLTVALALAMWWGLALTRLLYQPAPTVEKPAAAQQVFRRSLGYLALLFAAMVADTFL